MSPPRIFTPNAERIRFRAARLLVAENRLASPAHDYNKYDRKKGTPEGAFFADAPLGRAISTNAPQNVYPKQTVVRSGAEASRVG